MASTTASFTKPEADFWRGNNVLPDNANDTTEAVRRLGSIGIGGATITEAMPIIGTPSAVNSLLHLSSSATNRGQLMFGNSPLSYYLTRTFPVVVDDFVDLFNISIGGGAHNLRLSVVVSDTNVSIAKTYICSIPYNLTANNWRILLPITDSGPSNGNNFDVLFRNTTNQASFRVRRTLGATAGTIRVRVEYVGGDTAALTEFTTTGNDTTVYPSIGSFAPLPDFWRSGTGTVLPNNITDTTENIARTGKVLIGSDDSTLSTATFDVNGSVNVWAKAYTDFTANATLDTAANSVNNFSTFTINQTTPNITVNLPNPTVAAATHGRIVTVANIGTTQIFVQGQFINPSNAQGYIWTGAWVPIGTMPKRTNTNASRNLTFADHLTTITTSANVTLTIPLNLGYFLCRIRQANGIATIAAAAGVTLVAPNGVVTTGNGTSMILEVIGNTAYLE